MQNLVTFFGEQGLMLAAGSTGLLAIGAIAQALLRSPVHQQRAGELTVLAVLAWASLACVPLPRIEMSWIAPLGNRDPIDSIENSVSSPEHGTHRDRGLISEAATSPAPDEAFVLDQQRQALLAEVNALSAELLEVDGAASAVREISTSNQDAPYELLENGTATEMPQPESTAITGSTELATRPVAVTTNLPASPRDVTSMTTIESAANWNWRAIAAWSYLATVALGCAWLLLGRFILAGICLRARVADDWLRELSVEFAEHGRACRLLVSSRIDRPFSYGLVRGTIVLPERMCVPERTDALRQVILHEFAHVARRDAVGHLLFNLAFPLLAVHPLYWLVRARTLLAAELIADDWAARYSSRDEYAEQLLRLARDAGEWRVAPFSALPIFRSTSQFTRRMTMLIERTEMLPSRCSTLWRVACGVTFAASLLVATALCGIGPAAVADDEQKTDEPAPAATTTETANAEEKPAEESKKDADPATAPTTETNSPAPATTETAAEEKPALDARPAVTPTVIEKDPVETNAVAADETPSPNTADLPATGRREASGNAAQSPPHRLEYMPGLPNGDQKRIALVASSKLPFRRLSQLLNVVSTALGDEWEVDLSIDDPDIVGPDKSVLAGNYNAYRTIYLKVKGARGFDIKMPSDDVIRQSGIDIPANLVVHEGRLRMSDTYAGEKNRGASGSEDTATIRRTRGPLILKYQPSTDDQSVLRITTSPKESYSSIVRVLDLLRAKAPSLTTMQMLQSEQIKVDEIHVQLPRSVWANLVNEIRRPLAGNPSTVEGDLPSELRISGSHHLGSTLDSPESFSAESEATNASNEGVSASGSESRDSATIEERRARLRGRKRDAESHRVDRARDSGLVADDSPSVPVIDGPGPGLPAGEYRERLPSYRGDDEPTVSKHIAPADDDGRLTPNDREPGPSLPRSTPTMDPPTYNARGRSSSRSNPGDLPTYSAESNGPASPGRPRTSLVQSGMNPQAGATAQSMVPMFDRNAGMGMGLPSDVVSLAMTYTEAVSAEISAASEFARVEPLQKKGYINEAQLREVEAKLQLARRKVQLLRTIIPILTETADVERSVIRKRLEEIQKREEEGSPLSEDRNAEIELQLREFQTQARLQILQELQKQIKESSAKADPEERPAGSKEPANSSN